MMQLTLSTVNYIYAQVGLYQLNVERINANLNQQMSNMDNAYLQNDNNMMKITIEGEHLLDTISHPSFD